MCSLEMQYLFIYSYSLLILKYNHTKRSAWSILGLLLAVGIEKPSMFGKRLYEVCALPCDTWSQVGISSLQICVYDSRTISLSPRAR